eukprot:scaffold1071_cov328-Pavlova_lutheri.AAC.4
MYAGDVGLSSDMYRLWIHGIDHTAPENRRFLKKGESPASLYYLLALLEELIVGPWSPKE